MKHGSAPQRKGAISAAARRGRDSAAWQAIFNPNVLYLAAISPGARRMDYRLTEEQQSIVAAAERICAKFPLEYWLERDREGGFPEEFYNEVARGGWLGIAMPEAYGGAGLG